MGDDERVRLIRPGDRSEGQTTPGMRREQAVSTDRSWAGYVPPHTVHREGNPTSAEAAVIVVRAGSGEAVFNVDGPDET